MNQSVSILLVGCGKMGGAVLNGALQNGFSPEHIFVVEPNNDIRKVLKDKKIVSAPSLKEMNYFKPDIVFLAVKPFLIEQIISDIKPFTDNGAALLSIIAGRKIAWFKEKLGMNTVVFRAMPNTPAAIGAGITGIIASPEASDKQYQIVETLLTSCGQTVWLKSEEHIDAVTAVSGSGPAYVFYLTEALTQAAVSLGLDQQTAQKLAKNTIIGAAALMAESDENPDVLRKNVTTPNGTTAAALDILMNPDSGLTPLLEKAVSAAKKRSEELALV